MTNQTEMNVSESLSVLDPVLHLNRGLEFHNKSDNVFSN